MGSCYIAEVQLLVSLVLPVPALSVAQGLFSAGEATVSCSLQIYEAPFYLSSAALQLSCILPLHVCRTPLVTVVVPTSLNPYYERQSAQHPTSNSGPGMH